MNILIDGNITSPKGFRATGGYCGIKKKKTDLMLLVSDTPCRAAGSFTTNVVKAAPVLWDMEIIEKKGMVRGLITNSGNANACTGAQGLKDTEAMAGEFAGLIGCAKEEILVCSTGVIGVPLPMDLVTKGIRQVFPGLGYTREDGVMASKAIMTTDTFPKTCSVTVEIGGREVIIGGIAKGSGMIHPNMATLLAHITTDCAISQEMLDKAVKEAVGLTYNMISVDGDTSTNDTLLVLANGLAENPLIDLEGEEYEIFLAALVEVNKTLAVAIAKDGEGASKLMEVHVHQAKTKKDAVLVAKSVVSSNLFKAALFGEDANWGRVLCAMGYSGGDFDPFLVSLTFSSNSGEILLIDQGKPIVFDEEKAKKILKEEKIYIDIYLAQGNGEATAWGCDLTYDYVKINGDYRS